MARITKVLIANRGEIAVRVVRAARDAGIVSVAVYADQDRTARHVVLADEAYALDGTTSAETYLVVEKILAIARRSGADAVHPGYGFLAENADFARSVIQAGLTWIGPSPDAIERLGDKVSARHVAEKVGAPLAPGTLNPVADADEVLAFVDQVGLPVAIKAAFGGGGRGLKVARTREEVPELFESATREAIAAFGRGECFVEKYLDEPRHVETQCLADAAGNVVVISTRDCSLQRRHQKLVEEAPAPFLTDAQREQLYSSSKAILREVGYLGAGTCEFLIGKDGTVSFLEVNTRLQVEHPVSEEVTGIDLVREQFRLAEGGLIDYDDPEPRGHSIEFRINGEDPGRNFLPMPGPVQVLRFPGGPGIRVDSGVTTGDVISGAFDSAAGQADRDRRHPRGRARARPARPGRVRGRRAADGAAFFTGSSCATPRSRLPTGTSASTPAGSRPRSPVRSSRGRRADGCRSAGEAPSRARRGRGQAGHSVAADQPVAVRIRVDRPARTSRRALGGDGDRRSDHGADAGHHRQGRRCGGDRVVKGDLVLVLEAMKMEQPLTAHKDGTVASVNATVGATVSAGHQLLTLVD